MESSVAVLVGNRRWYIFGCILVASNEFSYLLPDITSLWTGYVPLRPWISFLILSVCRSPRDAPSALYMAHRQKRHEPLIAYRSSGGLLPSKEVESKLKAQNLQLLSFGEDRQSFQIRQEHGTNYIDVENDQYRQKSTPDNIRLLPVNVAMAGMLTM